MASGGSILIFIALAAVAAGAAVYALFFERMTAGKTAERRLNTVRTSAMERNIPKSERDKASDILKRRKSLQDNLKDLDERQKRREKNQKYPPLRMLLVQAGIKASVRKYYILSACCALGLTFAALIFGVPKLLLPGVLIVGFFGLPRWFVLFKRKRRIKAFLEEFPNSLDVIVRATRSGLPLNDGLRMIASEAVEPVRGEFRRIIESQQMGLSIPLAAAKMPDTMPCSEANFFAIVITIQAQAGGNLSEALGNLSRVLRERKKMKAKINAMSMEAKASGGIIGSLPFIVTLLIYLTSPDYIMLLFTNSTGNIILVCAGIWMSIGIFIMRNMINFDF